MTRPRNAAARPNDPYGVDPHEPRLGPQAWLWPVTGHRGFCRRSIGSGDAVWRDRQAGGSGSDRGDRRGRPATSVSAQRCGHRGARDDAGGTADNRRGRDSPVGRQSESTRCRGGRTVVSAAQTSSRLVRLYPKRWRERYGQEMEALIVESSGGHRVSWRMRVDVARGAGREQLRSAGLADSGAPGDQVRAGVLLVLCAWALFVVGGIAVQKFSSIGRARHRQPVEVPRPPRSRL